jgi:hypothetical protein
MATKKFYHDIDLLGVGSIINARLQTVDSAELAAMAGNLGVANKGLVVWNETDNKQYIWTGTEFRADALEVTGNLIYRGALAAADFGNRPAFTESGSQYVVTEAGSLSFLAEDGLSAMDFQPSAEVEAGDMVIFTDPDTAYVVQKNDAYATETVAGNIQLASTAEVDAGTNATKAVTPKGLADRINGLKLTRLYSGTHNVIAGDNAIAHGLNLADVTNYVVSVKDSAGVEVAVQITNSTANELTISSDAPITGAKVTVIGF